MSAHSYGALCQTGASWREPPFGSPQRTLWAVRPAGRFATIPPRWPLPRTCCVHARLSAMVRGLAERVAVTAESRVAPSWDASSSHAPVTGADRGGAMLLSSTGGDRLSGRSSDKPAVPADDSTAGNNADDSTAGNNADDSTAGSSSPVDTLADNLSGTPSAHLCGKPCGRPAAAVDTRTGSSPPPPSPDRRPLHLTTTPARVRAGTLAAVPPGQAPLQRATPQRGGWVRLPNCPRSRSGMYGDP
jgi:hypothetical protein